jgi:hypothetical protein
LASRVVVDVILRETRPQVLKKAMARWFVHQLKSLQRNQHEEISKAHVGDALHLRIQSTHDVISEARFRKSGDARNKGSIECFLSKVQCYKCARKEAGLLDTGFFIASGNGTVMHEYTLLLTAAFIDCEVGLDKCINYGSRNRA